MKPNWFITYQNIEIIYYKLRNKSKKSFIV